MDITDHRHGHLYYHYGGCHRTVAQMFRKIMCRDGRVVVRHSTQKVGVTRPLTEVQNLRAHAHTRARELHNEENCVFRLQSFVHPTPNLWQDLPSGRQVPLPLTGLSNFYWTCNI